MFQKDNERKREMKKWKFLTAAIGITMAVLVFAVFQGGAVVKAVIPGGNIPDGRYAIQSVNSGKVIDSTLNTVPLIETLQWGYHGENQQKWLLEHLGNNEYKMISLYTGKVLDVAYDSQADGGMIIVSDWHGGNNQRWKFELIGYNTYAIKSVSSGKYLSVNSALKTNGAKIHQWTYVGAQEQMWVLHMEEKFN